MLDFHCHSTCSDGSYTPEQIAEMGSGFSALALTDHDCCDGVERFMNAAVPFNGIRLSGLEISVAPGDGYSIFHMLMLGVDCSSPRLVEMLESVRNGREERNRQILARLAGVGVEIAEEELGQYAGGQIVARPHIARALVARGLASSMADAFTRFLKKGGPGYVDRFRPSATDAIEVAHEAGGVAIMAHPRFYTGDPDMLRTGLAALKDSGLDGIEAMYRANSFEDTLLHLRVASELDFIVTAGSDFHGANRPEVMLGMEPPDEDEMIHRLLAKIGNYRR